MAAPIYLNLLTLLIMNSLVLDLDPATWIAINDGVMGGVSSSSMTAPGGHLQFAGALSLDNNGGFASVRRRIEACPPETDRVRLEVRGDGRNYQFRLRQDEQFDGIAWRARFSTADEWQSIILPLAQFEPVFRGRRVRDAGRLRAADIRQAGFMLADGQAGPFRLEIRVIEFLAAGYDEP